MNGQHATVTSQQIRSHTTCANAPAIRSSEGCESAHLYDPTLPVVRNAHSDRLQVERRNQLSVVSFACAMHHVSHAFRGSRAATNMRAHQLARRRARQAYDPISCQQQNQQPLVLRAVVHRVTPTAGAGARAHQRPAGNSKIG